MQETIKTFEFSNATVTVHIPEFSSKRMEELKGATEGLLIDLIKKGQFNNDKNIKTVEN
jgi:hypothetical protein